MMYYIKQYTFKQFDLLPEDKKILNYTEDIIEDAKYYNYELPPLQNTHENILLYWNEGNQLYVGLKLTLLIPAIIHISYYMFTQVNNRFNAFCNYKQSPLCEAQKILIKIEIQTNLNKKLYQNVLLPVYHYYYQGKYYQQITFENEVFNVREEEGQIILKQKYIDEEFIYDNEKEQLNLTEQEVSQKQQLYGLNQIKIEYPQFLKIAKEELLTPYFAFQIISTILYSLDNYTSYSLMNFAILLFSQTSNIYQKYVSLRNTVKLAPKTCLVTVIRDNKEQIVNSKELVPGDHVIYKKQDYDQVIEIEDEDKEENNGEQQRKPTQLEILKQQAIYKMLFRIYDLLFAKYYEQSIVITNDKEKRSLIFPADMILTKGQLISEESNLTGEQASQIKEAAQSNDIQHHNIVFAGTQLIQLQDQECHFIVKTTRTSTEQGQLIKSIIFNDSRLKTQTSDSTIFLILMSLCALVSSIYTFIRGYKNHVTSLSNLILECLIIFVSIVPPDLPSQLSMVITDSIAALREKKIFSTDPYKLLNAGRCQCVCFDKSGTLTQSDLSILGVDEQLNENSYQTILKAKNSKNIQINVNKDSKLVISGCNSVTKLNNQILGDLLEINAIKSCLQSPKIQDNEIEYQGGKTQILKRFYFTSNLKRMTCIVQQGNQQYTVIKGSPEIIYNLLDQKPSRYYDLLNKYTNNGFRVLTLAYKQSNYNVQEFDKLQRSEVEKGFKFVGFLICQTPLKSQTKQSIEKLKEANVNVKVISGDYVINVVVSSREAGICNQKLQGKLITSISEEQIGISNLDQTEEEKVKISEIQELSKKYTLCASGNIINKILSHQMRQKIINCITIFARTTPKQKSDIIQCIQKTWTTVYVGDGVNDLTALKISDVGVALLSEINDKEAQKQEQQKAKKIPYPRVMQQPGNRPASYQQLIEYADRLSRQNRTNINYELQILLREQQQYKQFLRLQSLNQKSSQFYSIINAFEAEDDLEDNATQTATIAASFSSKISQISSVIEIIRQGSSCVDKVRFNYIQNALASIVGAYSMTVMTLNGIASGLLFTIISFLFSKLKPIEKIKISNKQQKIVDFPFILSTILQSGIHISVFFLIQHWCMSVMETVAFTTAFKPSILNTCVFYVSIIQDFTVTMANFTNLRLQVNKNFILGLCAYIVLFLALVLEIQPELNEQLGLVLLSNDLKMKVILLCLFDFFGCFTVEKLLSK